MGLTYSFQLGFPADRAADVLRATAAMAAPLGESRVRLPDGTTLTVPFTVRFESGDVTLGTEPWTLFDAVLWLPVDAPVRALAEECETGDPVFRLEGREGGDGPEVAIGFIYLTVGVGERYALFTFSAPTSDISRLFEDSAAIRGRFARLLAENGGLIGLFDQHGPPFRLLPDLERSVVFDEDGMLQLEGDADAWVAAALAAEGQGG